MRPLAAMVFSLGLLVGAGAPGAQQQVSPNPLAAPQLAQISGDPAKPRRHFRVPNAADMDAEKSEKIYAKLGEKMAALYKLSGHPVAKEFRTWKRYNSAPYRSATHGRRFLNNYASKKAAAYGKFEGAGMFPKGAVIAKDSFAVTEDGRVNAGPLFIMEKMAQGFNDASGDWRYTMIMPDGTIYGTTKGESAERVKYCIGCHLTRERNDHLYFVPQKFRVKN